MRLQHIIKLSGCKIYNFTKVKFLTDNILCEIDLINF